MEVEKLASVLINELEADIEKNKVTVDDLNKNLNNKDIDKCKEVVELIEKAIMSKNATIKEAIILSRPYGLDILRVHEQCRLKKLAGV